MCRLPLSGLAVAPGGAALSAAHVTQLSAPGAAPGKPASGRGQYDDEFLQFSYKVVPCNKSFRHDFATCPFAHAGESSQRRHPSAYLPFLCGATQHSTDLKEKCPFGPACKYAHSHFELWLHPGRFRTKMCSLGERCKRPVCFFAHNEAELRATPYSKLDTAAAVAAQQLPDMGQLLEPNVLAGCSAGSLACSTDSKVCGASSFGSSSDAGRSGTSSPSNSLSCDDAAALAKLTASMAGMRTTAAAAAAPGMVDVGSMARLHAAGGSSNNTAYLTAAAAAIDASLSGDAASLSMASTASGMWPLQQQQPQVAYCNAGGFAQAPAALAILDAQLVGAGFGCSDMWMLQQRSAAAAAPQWPAASPMAPQTCMLPAQHHQPHLAFNAPVAAAGLPMPSLLATAGLQQAWPLPLERSLSVPQQQPQMVQQLLSNQQAMQHLLGMM